MQFNIGQRVGFLYETGGGVIRSLTGEQAMVEDEDGFERTFYTRDLVFIHSENYADDDVIIEKEGVESDLSFRVIEERTGQRKPLTVWEVDLHIEELIDSHRGMSNTEIMLKQLGEFRTMFKKAKKQSVHKLIVIHGVGEGVLKSEIRSYLALQDQIEVYDADFSEYGKGATTVEFHPNWV